MARRSHLVGSVLGLLACQAAVRAVVTTDGSLGARSSFSGNNVTLPASLGRQKGGNLFHSFDQFDVPDGGSVTFAGPASVKNVLARVTGGQISHIDGNLVSSIAGGESLPDQPGRHRVRTELESRRLRHLHRDHGRCHSAQ